MEELPDDSIKVPEEPRIQVDRPIDALSADKLRRNHFIEPITSMLQLLPNSPSVVVGLEGKWGSGKTSCINLIKKNLEATNTIVVHYNPWLVSAIDSLLSGFFVQFATSIGQRAGDTTTQKAAKQILRYGQLLAPIKLIPGVEPWGTMAEKLVKPGLSAISQQNSFGDWDLHTQKSALEDAVMALGQHVVVIIDDLDRLPQNEIRLVFQLIKAISDFQGVAYLVAYDVDVIAAALGFDCKVKGRAYLEKLVQIQCPVPRLSVSDRNLLFREATLEELKSHACHNMSVEEAYLNEFFESTGSGLLISTPRDLVRLRNRIRFQKSWAGNEILFGDLVGFELLSMLFPESVRYIVEHWEKFVDTSMPETESLPRSLQWEAAVEHLNQKSAGASAQVRSSELPTLLELCYPSSSRPTTLSENHRRVVTALISFMFPRACGREKYNSSQFNSPKRIDQADTFLKVVQGATNEISQGLADCYDFIKKPFGREEILDQWNSRGITGAKLGLSARLLKESEIHEPAELVKSLVTGDMAVDANVNLVRSIVSFVIELILTLNSKTEQSIVLKVFEERNCRLDIAGRVLWNLLDQNPFEVFNGLPGDAPENMVTNERERPTGEVSEDFRSVLEVTKSKWIEAVESLFPEQEQLIAPPWIGVTLAFYSGWKPEKIECVHTYIKSNMNSPEFLDSLLHGTYPEHPNFSIPNFFPEDFAELLDQHHPEHSLTRYWKRTGKLQSNGTA